jgi:hypothetical protein
MFTFWAVFGASKAVRNEWCSQRFHIEIASACDLSGDKLRQPACRGKNTIGKFFRGGSA